MQLNEYQLKVVETFSYTKKKTLLNPKMGLDSSDNRQVVWLGLAGEVGEVFEIVKKVIRDKGGNASIQDVSNIQLELGDVLWHIAAIAEMYGLNLEEVAQANIEKLAVKQV